MHLLILLFLLPFILLTVAYHHPSRLLGEDIHRPEEDHTADEFNGGGMDWLVGFDNASEICL